MEVKWFIYLVYTGLTIGASVPEQGTKNEIRTERKDERVNERPVIGLISQKVTQMLTPDVIDSDTYIAASYVKYLESAGAEVVPLVPSYLKEKGKIEGIVKNLNGVLFPGGSAPMFTSGYYKIARIVFDMAKKANDDGEYFPLWGTCLGFETLHNLVGGGKEPKDTVLSDFSAVDISLAVNFTVDAFKSRMFNPMPQELMRFMMSYPNAFHFHESGVSPNTYKKNEKLSSFFNILATNLDKNGKKFVSIVEAKKYPFYGTQWHPEKNIHEWNTAENIDHNPNSIFIAQHLANFFVNEARKNKRRFPTIADAEKHSMFKLSAKYSGQRSHFEQVYVFGKSKERIKGRRHE